MLKIIAEIGTCFASNKPQTVAGAVRTAFNCGADLVKLQWFVSDQLACRRGGRGKTKSLVPWVIPIDHMNNIIDKYKGRVGVSIFALWNGNPKYFADFAFIKTATQEYQNSMLAQNVSEISMETECPLVISVPRDGCLVVGNYFSPKPITWLYAEPRYPALYTSYLCGQCAGAARDRIQEMKSILPGEFGLSDHTVDSKLATYVIRRHPDLACVEKHFCYSERLRGKTPDSGPWSLGTKAFAQFVRDAKRQQNA